MLYYLYSQYTIKYLTQYKMRYYNIIISVITLSLNQLVILTVVKILGSEEI